MTNIEAKLSRLLYRALCPGSLELGEYQLHTLPAERQVAIRDHLKECPLCAREVEQLRTFLNETSQDVELSPLEQVRILVAHLLESKGSSGMVPAWQVIRGDKEHLLTYEADDTQVILDIQNDHDRPDLKAVIGLVITSELGQLNAALLQAGELISTASVDEFGNFKLAPIPPGKYALILSNPAVEIQIKELLVE
jgi:hypothetical protein